MVVHERKYKSHTHTHSCSHSSLILYFSLGVYLFHSSHATQQLFSFWHFLLLLSSSTTLCWCVYAVSLVFTYVTKYIYVTFAFRYYCHTYNDSRWQIVNVFKLQSIRWPYIADPYRDRRTCIARRTNWHLTRYDIRRHTVRIRSEWSARAFPLVPSSRHCRFISNILRCLRLLLLHRVVSSHYFYSAYDALLRKCVCEWMRMCVLCPSSCVLTNQTHFGFTSVCVCVRDFFYVELHLIRNFTQNSNSDMGRDHIHFDIIVRWKNEHLAVIDQRPVHASELLMLSLLLFTSTITVAHSRQATRFMEQTFLRRWFDSFSFQRNV